MGPTLSPGASSAYMRTENDDALPPALARPTSFEARLAPEPDEPPARRRNPEDGPFPAIVCVRVGCSVSIQTGGLGMDYKFTKSETINFYYAQSLL